MMRWRRRTQTHSQRTGRDMNSDKIILDLCGGTRAWSKPYADAGYDVRVITLPEHDVRRYQPPDNVYGILAAPPCTMFSFCRTNAKKPRDLRSGMDLVTACLDIIWHCQYRLDSDQQKYSPLKFWALENPFYGSLSWFLGRPALVFNPYDFGDAYQKKTSLWGKFNELKKNPVRLTEKMKKSAKTNSYLHKIGTKFDMLKTKDIAPEHYGKHDRQARRAITPPGFAKAFMEANQ